ncbi:MAG: hypothetical protein JWM32_279 [Verrucomicrobia bacterium]|nr:hypothetical protein [Verrucomicrobiota bacterium]
MPQAQIKTDPPLDRSTAYSWSRPPPFSRAREAPHLRDFRAIKTNVESVAQQLIARELRVDNVDDSEGRAAFRVCEKLRRPLSTFAGINGFRSLLTRALVLARAKEAWLETVLVNADGSVLLPPALEDQLKNSAAARGGRQLTVELLQLLVTFIGEPLTMRLVEDVWPRLAAKKLNPRGKKL